MAANNLNFSSTIQSIYKKANAGDAEAQNKLANNYFHGTDVKQDYKAAFEWYTRAAALGSAAAEISLGHMYEEGLHVQRNAEAAFALYERAARKGYAIAENAVGSAYVHGIGVKQDYKAAFEWFQLSAQHCCTMGQFNLGFAYASGLGVPKNPQLAMQWYITAADKRCPEARHNLGKIYEDGRYEEFGFIKDHKKSAEFFRQAAEQGYSESQYSYGRALLLGKGVDKDAKKACEWFTCAAEQGNVKAQHALGECYDNATGVKQDFKQAFEWYKRAAEKGHVESQLLVADAYIFGEGVAKDQKLGYELLERAAAQGNVEAQFRLGIAYADGEHISKDNSKAVHFLELAVKQRHAEAQYRLGCIYSNGQGVKQDFKRAAEFYELAANQKFAPAQYSLGMAHFLGQGVSMDLLKAIQLFVEAAKQGDADAEYRLGFLCSNAIGMPKDQEMAIELYKRAANRNSEAQFELGWAYTKGDGVPEDLNLAIGWLRKAANALNFRAQRTLGCLYLDGKWVVKDKKELSEAIDWMLISLLQGGSDITEKVKKLAKEKNNSMASVADYALYVVDIIGTVKHSESLTNKLLSISANDLKKIDELITTNDTTNNSADNKALNDRETQENIIAFQWAAYHGRLEILRHILEKTKLTDVKTIKRACFLATLGGQHLIIKYLSKTYPVSLTEPDKNGNTFLHLAASSGQLDTVKWLLSQGVYIDAVNKSKQTPINATNKNQFPAVVSLLESAEKLIEMIRKGSPVEATKKILEILKDGGAVNGVLKDGLSALYLTVRSAHRLKDFYLSDYSIKNMIMAFLLIEADGRVDLQLKETIPTPLKLAREGNNHHLLANCLFGKLKELNNVRKTAQSSDAKLDIEIDSIVQEMLSATHRMNEADRNRFCNLVGVHFAIPEHYNLSIASKFLLNGAQPQPVMGFANNNSNVETKLQEKEKEKVGQADGDQDVVMKPVSDNSGKEVNGDKGDKKGTQEQHKSKYKQRRSHSSSSASASSHSSSHSSAHSSSHSQSSRENSLLLPVNEPLLFRKPNDADKQNNNTNKRGIQKIEQSHLLEDLQNNGDNKKRRIETGKG